jgi:hypothetical protein
MLNILYGRARPGHRRRWAANTSGSCHDFVKRHGKMAANLFHFVSLTTFIVWTIPAMTAPINSIIWSRLLTRA